MAGPCTARRSGSVDYRELRSALGTMGVTGVRRDVVKAMIATADPNGDGVLEYRELLAVLKKAPKAASEKAVAPEEEEVVREVKVEEEEEEEEEQEEEEEVEVEEARDDLGALLDEFGLGALYGVLEKAAGGRTAAHLEALGQKKCVALGVPFLKARRLLMRAGEVADRAEAEDAEAEASGQLLDVAAAEDEEEEEEEEEENVLHEDEEDAEEEFDGGDDGRSSDDGSAGSGAEVGYGPEGSAGESSREEGAAAGADAAAEGAEQRAPHGAGEVVEVNVGGSEDGEADGGEEEEEEDRGPPLWLPAVVEAFLPEGLEGEPSESGSYAAS